MIHLGHQLDADWFAMRCGAVTSSRLSDVCAKLKRKDGEAAARAAYRTELIIERLTGQTADHYVSPAMEHGILSEPMARAEYEIKHGQEVQQIALAMHPEIKYFSASTDGLVGEDGMLEIKCPSSATHMNILISGNIPEEYHLQMLGGMACAERQWCDFVSYDPRLPEPHQLFVCRLQRDDAKIAAMENEVRLFLAEVDEMIDRLKHGSNYIERKLQESIESLI